MSKTEIIYQKGDNSYYLKGVSADLFLNKYRHSNHSSLKDTYSFPESISHIYIKNKKFVNQNVVFFENSFIYGNTSSIIFEDCTFLCNELLIKGKDVSLKNIHYLKDTSVILYAEDRLDLDVQGSLSSTQYQLKANHPKASEYQIHGDGCGSKINLSLMELQVLSLKNLSHVSIDFDICSYIDNFLVEKSDFDLEYFESCKKLCLKDSTIHFGRLDLQGAQVFLENSRLIGESLLLDYGKIEKHPNVVMEDDQNAIMINKSEKLLLQLKLFCILQRYQKTHFVKIQKLAHEKDSYYDHKKMSLLKEIRQLEKEKENHYQCLKKELERKPIKDII